MGASYYATPYTISLLKVVWADPELWRRVARNAPSQEITLYIKRRYRLIFPNIPAKFWKALAKDQAQRGTLFDTIALQSWRVISPEPELATRLVMQELSDKRFFRLVAEYLSASGLDCKSLLASQEFSSPAIRAIKSLGKRLFEDAEWCLKCVGQIHPQSSATEPDSRGTFNTPQPLNHWSRSQSLSLMTPTTNWRNAI